MREIEFLLYQYSCSRNIKILKIRNQQHHCHLNQTYSEGTLLFKFINSMLASSLGKGGFSEVDLEIIDQQFYACKKISLDNYSVNYLVSELNSLRCLNHPNIVKCYGFSVKSFKSFDIYLEYIRGNTIDKAYLNIKSQELLFYWIFQIAQALNYLQSLGIVHRDIKPKNIMVTQKGLVKLVDFGISKFLSYSQFSVAGSPSYIAPQVLNKKLLCPLSDIWSLGITIYQLIHKHLPFENKYEPKQFNQNKYHSKRGKDISESQFSCSVEMKTLLTAMLNKDPEKRIRPNGVLNHPAIKSREKHFEELYMKDIENL